MELNEINIDILANLKVSKNKDLLYSVDDTNTIGRSFTLDTEGVPNIKYNDIVFNLANGTIWTQGVFLVIQQIVYQKKSLTQLKMRI